MLCKKLCTVSIAIVALSSVPCTAAETGALAAANGQTRQFIQQTLKQQRIPGLQIAVIKDGRVVLSESYGFANVENRVAVTDKTLFPINSATTSFTGVAIMQLP